jgi:hypothetical protein
MLLFWYGLERRNPENKEAEVEEVHEVQQTVEERWMVWKEKAPLVWL